MDKVCDKETFITLAKLACCDVVFSRHDGFYTQIDRLGYLEKQCWISLLFVIILWILD